MESMFQENLKKLTKKYSQKLVAEKTGFSQSSINNYLTRSSEPSIQFLIALKDAFGISVEDFLFSGISTEGEKSYEKFIGNYLIYYYNNDSYKGEVHLNLKNTLNFGVISIFKQKDLDKGVEILSAFTKSRVDAVKLLKSLNESPKTTYEQLYDDFGNVYTG